MLGRHLDGDERPASANLGASRANTLTPPRSAALAPRGWSIVDLERLVAVRGPDLDHGYVRRWIVDMMGQDDDRVRRWDDIVARFGAPPSDAAPHG